MPLPDLLQLNTEAPGGAMEVAENTELPTLTKFIQYCRQNFLTELSCRKLTVGNLCIPPWLLLIVYQPVDILFGPQLQGAAFIRSPLCGSERRQRGHRKRYLHNGTFSIGFVPGSRTDSY